MHPPSDAQIARARRAVIHDGTGHGGLLHDIRLRLHWRILRLARPQAEATPGTLIRAPCSRRMPAPPRHLPPLRPFGGDAA